MPVVSVNGFFSRDTHWEEKESSELLPDTVDIWNIEVITDAILINSFCTLLDSKELDRLNRYHRENDRHRFITSRGFLRILLGKYLHQKPENIQFSKGFNNKPFVLTAGKEYLKYNVSHSGSHVLIAISKAEIGVDIEEINGLFSYDDIIRTAFNENEIKFVNDSKQPVKTFYLFWTRKEALLKATGKGLTDNLKSVPSLGGDHVINNELLGSCLDWKVESFMIGKEYAGSVAYPSFVQTINYFKAGNQLLKF
ncbi:MAG: 4'-phosphopantetheinyl transferase superfamily protein [Bacteroidota bacterium]